MVLNFNVSLEIKSLLTGDSRKIQNMLHSSSFQEGKIRAQLQEQIKIQLCNNAHSLARGPIGWR